MARDRNQVLELWGHLDEDTRAHLVRVGSLAGDLACHVGLSAKEQDEARLAGLVHDIGKLGIPDEIVAKAGGGACSPGGVEAGGPWRPNRAPLFPGGGGPGEK